MVPRVIHNPKLSQMPKQSTHNKIKEGVITKHPKRNLETVKHKEASKSFLGSRKRKSYIVLSLPI